MGMPIKTAVKMRTTFRMLVSFIFASHVISSLIVSLNVSITISNAPQLLAENLTSWMPNGEEEKEDPTARKKQIAIFYNVFLPPNTAEKGYEQALDIVKDQMSQIKHSLHQHHEENITTRSGEPIKVYYVNIGREFPSLTYFQDKICSPNHLECVKIAHLDQGFEEFTLQALYQFCQRHDQGKEAGEVSDSLQDADFRVVYLHSKGTYHPSEAQNEWRQELTAGALVCYMNRSQRLTRKFADFSSLPPYFLCLLSFHSLLHSTLPASILRMDCATYAAARSFK
jgi:hypothetical protein